MFGCSWFSLMAFQDSLLHQCRRPSRASCKRTCPAPQNRTLRRHNDPCYDFNGWMPTCWCWQSLIGGGAWASALRWGTGWEGYGFEIWYSGFLCCRILDTGHQFVSPQLVREEVTVCQRWHLPLCWLCTLFWYVLIVRCSEQLHMTSWIYHVPWNTLSQEGELTSIGSILPEPFWLETHWMETRVACSSLEASPFLAYLLHSAEACFWRMSALRLSRPLLLKLYFCWYSFVDIHWHLLKLWCKDCKDCETGNGEWRSSCGRLPTRCFLPLERPPF